MTRTGTSKNNIIMLRTYGTIMVPDAVCNQITESRSCHQFKLFDYTYVLYKLININVQSVLFLESETTCVCLKSKNEEPSQEPK